MPLFKSKEEQEAEAQLAIEMGRASVKDYIRNCRKAGDRYLVMARKAMTLRHVKQTEHYIGTHLQYHKQADKWESFLLKIEDVMLRGKAMSAMSGLMDGVSSVCKTIGRGLSAGDIKRTMVELKQASTKVDVAEQQMGKMLEAVDISVSGEEMELDLDDLPEGMRGEVDSIREALQREVDAEAGQAQMIKSQPKTPAGRASGATKAETIDNLLSDLERFRKS